MTDKSKSIERDLGFVQDAWEFVKHAVADEGHCFESFMIEGDGKFLDYLEKARKDRTLVMDMIAKGKGHAWCRSKHLAGKSMLAQELCTRFLSVGNKEKAKMMADKAKEFYLEFLTMNGFTADDLNNLVSSA